MPSISIDTFFACSLMVAVVIIATISVTGTMMTRISSWKNLNEETYLRTIYEKILSEPGTPSNWGSSSEIKPAELGLASSNSLTGTALDADKVTRLNPDSGFALSYTDILTAVRLTDLAISISVSQIMNVTAVMTSNSTEGGSTTYTFRISVRQDVGPVTAELHCYAIARDFQQNVYNSTSNDGTGYASFQIPNSSNGTAALIAFAKATQNPMMIAYTVETFPHLSNQPEPNKSFLYLSPLNSTLNINSKIENTTTEGCYAFSYDHESILDEITNTSREITQTIDHGSLVIAVTGINSSRNFVEWTTYPQIPFKTGSNFENTESYVFNGIVTIGNALYKIKLAFGGTNP